MNSFLMRIFFRIWYWYISTLDKNGEVIFMNYGYADNAKPIFLEASDEKNRYSAQLYHLVATGVDISGKDILEVGAGRGGGLDYVYRYLHPGSATGIDLNEKAVQFCNQRYQNESIKFLQADAENLSFEDCSFDVVINVESSHGYPHMDKFLAQVHRVLKPGGYFLFADFRLQEDIKTLKAQLGSSNLIIIREKNITDHVFEALTKTTNERLSLIQKLVPTFLHGIAKKFAAIQGSSMFEAFANHQYEYLYFVLKKPE